MGTEQDKMFAASQAIKETNEQKLLRYEEQSRMRLQRILEKKMSTAFIGALARFEEFFGQLWGHGKDAMDLTASERAWRARWEAVRQEILFNGNNQVRAIRLELPQYTMHWNKYQVILKPGGQVDAPPE